MPQAILTLHCRYGELEDTAAILWERGTLGLQELELAGGDYEIQAYFDAPFDASAIRGAIGWRETADVSGDDWQHSWQPMEAGQKLWLAPHWLAGEPPPGRVRVNIHPGQGSGTGYSEPTLLMLEILERELKPEDVVADIGTGSGILTAAAHALGARLLFACDVDATSAAEAAQSLAADGIDAKLWCGSPRSIAPAQATFVLANLNAIQLEGLATELRRLVAPGGRLLIGGFTERNLERMRKVFPSASAHFSRGPWQALLL